MKTAKNTPAPLFRFCLWNDMHVQDPRYFDPFSQEGLTEAGHYPFANEKGTWAVECASGKHGFEKPAFVVSAGDMINGEGAITSKMHDDFAYLKASILNEIEVPFLPCLGNHENTQGARNRPYDECFGKLWHNYVFTYGGVAFIVVDTSDGHRPPDTVTAARNGFVRRAFERFKGMPTFVVTHVPFIAMREEKILRESFGFSSWRVADTQMLEIIEEHAGSVIAVLCGHIHLTAIRKQNGIYHIMPSGTGGYPCDFASFECFSEKVVVRMHRGPEQWLPADHNGNIHGKPRYNIDYVDDLHSDPESYVWGNPDERLVTISLPPKKRIICGTKKLEVFHGVEPN